MQEEPIETAPNANGSPKCAASEEFVMPIAPPPPGASPRASIRASDVQTKSVSLKDVPRGDTGIPTVETQLSNQAPTSAASQKVSHRKYNAGTFTWIVIGILSLVTIYFTSLETIFFNSSSSTKIISPNTFSRPSSSSPATRSGSSVLGSVPPETGRISASDATSEIDSLRRRAESGNQFSQFELAESYAEGNLVIQDSAKAVEWYTKAAEQGHVQAQNRLGAMHSSGEGVSKDLAKAEYWWRLAAATGSNEARKSLARLEKETSSEGTTLTGMRTWTHRDGRTLTAELLSVSKNADGYYEGNFRRLDGTTFRFEIGNLSIEDVNHVKTLILK
jgi:hypothetical protein